MHEILPLWVMQEEFNMYDDSLNWSLRSGSTAIKEITASGDVIFVLAESGSAVSLFPSILFWLSSFYSFCLTDVCAF